MRQIEAVVIAALLSWEKTTHTEEVAVIAVTEVNYTGKISQLVAVIVAAVVN